MRPKKLNQGQLWEAAATGIRVARYPSGSPVSRRGEWMNQALIR
jgi:hypothetical protein